MSGAVENDSQPLPPAYEEQQTVYPQPAPIIPGQPMPVQPMPQAMMQQAYQPYLVLAYPHVQQTPPSVTQNFPGEFGSPRFKNAALATTMKVFSCLFSLVNIGLITAVSFEYFYNSACIATCDQHGPTTPRHDHRWTTTSRYDADKYYDCILGCYDSILPMAWPLFVCVVHACAVYGLALKDKFSSKGQVTFLCITYTAVTLLLTSSLICLVCVFAIGNEWGLSRDYPYVNSYGTYQSTSLSNTQLAAIVSSSLVLVFHIVDFINHKWSFDYTPLEEPAISEDIRVYKKGCHKTSAAGMKTAHCCFSVFALLFTIYWQFFAVDYNRDKSLILQIYNDGYMYYNDVWYSRYRFSENSILFVITTVPFQIWHTLAVLMTIPSSQHYETKSQSKLALAFYIIETFFLLVMVALCWTFGLLSNQLVEPILITVAFILWIVDFGMHQFPGACCQGSKSRGVSYSPAPYQYAYAVPQHLQPNAPIFTTSVGYGAVGQQYVIPATSAFK